MFKQQNRLATEGVEKGEDFGKTLTLARPLTAIALVKMSSFYAFLAYECLEKSILTTYVNFQKEIPLE